MEYKTISANDFLELLNSGKALNILDVRGKTEHEEKHLLAPHQHIPIDELKPQALGTGNEAIYVLCGGGKRAIRAAAMLAESGFENATVVTGGLRSCIAAGALITGADIKSPVTCKSGS
jgi:phage shock protein E